MWLEIMEVFMDSLEHLKQLKNKNISNEALRSLLIDKEDALKSE